VARTALVAPKATFAITDDDRQFKLQHRQQMLGSLQIWRIQAFHKGFEYWLKNCLGAIPLPPSGPQRGQIDGCS
jgi:hypothetical protein